MMILIGIMVGVVVLGGAIVLIVAGLRTNRSQDDEDPLMTTARGSHSAWRCDFLA